MIRRNRLDPRWWRSMPRIRPFHDSMRLFVAGIGVVQPLVGSRNVNRWFSRDTFADHASGSDEALAPVGDGAVRVRALPVKERVVRLPPLAVGGGPCGHGIRVRHAAQGDGDLPQLLACPGPWLDPGGLGDVHAHAEQAPPRLGIRPALAQRLRNATAPVAPPPPVAGRSRLWDEPTRQRFRFWRRAGRSHAPQAIAINTTASRCKRTPSKCATPYTSPTSGTGGHRPHDNSFIRRGVRAGIACSARLCLGDNRRGDVSGSAARRS